MIESEPFLTYCFQGFKFEFIRDELFVTNERHLPFFEKYRIQFSDDDKIPFVIILEKKGMEK